MGMDFGDELSRLGHEVRLFPYRRDNPLYKNTPTKAAYQRLILHRLERTCADWRPEIALVIKGGPIAPEVVQRVRARIGTRFVNFFPDNPLWMIPFQCLEAYDVFFTKERYALRSLQSVGLRNLHYLPMYCVPALHHPVTPTVEEQRRFAAGVSLVGNRYDYRERLVRELAGRPLRVWGSGWRGARDPAVRRLVAGGPVFGHDKLCVYAASTVSLNPHHPMNDIVGVNTRAFELAAPARWPITRKIWRPCSSPARRYSCIATWGSWTGCSTITWRDRTRPAPSATAPAGGRWPSTRCATASRRCCR